MTQALVATVPRQLRTVFATLPAFITDAGTEATRSFLEFFTANIRNKGTRLAYGRAVARFCKWCDERGRGLQAMDPILVSSYIEQLGHELAPPTVKQQLAAIRMLFNWLAEKY